VNSKLYKQENLKKTVNIRKRIVAIIIKNKKILLVKGKGYNELWTPGGKIEEGETQEETLKRELKEEINLEVLSMKFFKTYLNQSPYSKDWMTETKCFFATVNGTPKPQKEIEAIIWYGKDDGKNYPMIEENEKLIADLMKENLL